MHTLTEQHFLSRALDREMNSVGLHLTVSPSTWRPRAAPALPPVSMVAVLFPTRARALDAAWRLLEAADELKGKSPVADVPLFVAASRYAEPRPELFLNDLAYDLAARINIRLRDTEVSLLEQPPRSCGILLDTTQS